MNAVLCRGNHHHHFVWLSEVTLGSFGCFLVPSPSFTAMVFPRPVGAFLGALLCGRNHHHHHHHHHHHFLWFSEVRLGSFLHCHGVSLSGTCSLECYLVRRIARPGAAFLSAFLCGGNHHFLWVSEVTLGSFWLLFGTLRPPVAKIEWLRNLFV